MDKEQASIHDFDFNLICEYFSAIPRQGPGSPEVTLRALEFVPSLGADARIADIGCGTGGQTMVLAGSFAGQITGIDLFPDFIDAFNAQAHKLGLQDRVKGITGTMENLPFSDGELDLIWSEGAIYNIGFERGMREWKRFLKPGGYIAVTEASWFTNERPAEIDAFWNEAYPLIDTVAGNIAKMQAAGYVPIASFILPENCWTEHFYLPQVEAQLTFLQRHAGNPAAEGLVANQRHEAQLYETYKAFYGYVFYIGMRI